jgi:hypothetical protein
VIPLINPIARKVLGCSLKRDMKKMRMDKCPPKKREMQPRSPPSFIQQEEMLSSKEHCRIRIPPFSFYHKIIHHIKPQKYSYTCTS